MMKSRHPIDVHVGKRVKERRKLLKLTQSHLATTLGLSFQQVQKYERGVNRFSASKLFEAAQCLRVPIGYFFEGIDMATGAQIMRLAEENDPFDTEPTNEIRDLILAFEAIKEPEDRRDVIAYAHKAAARTRGKRQSKT